MWEECSSCRRRIKKGKQTSIFWWNNSRQSASHESHDGIVCPQGIWIVCDTLYYLLDSYHHIILWHPSDSERALCLLSFIEFCQYLTKLWKCSFWMFSEHVFLIMRMFRCIIFKRYGNVTFCSPNIPKQGATFKTRYRNLQLKHFTSVLFEFVF